MKPEISVVTSVYNGEKYLSETIESVLGQTFENFEDIIIDDCSQDESRKIMEGYAKKDKRIILIHNNTNIGSAESRNVGIKKASGTYIAILDHDDIAMPERLQKQYEFLEKNPEIFLAGSGAIHIDENGTVVKKFTPITSLRRIRSKLPNANCFHHPSVMYRNTGDIFYRSKIFYSDDNDFYLRLLSDNRTLANLPDALIKYRIHSKASSQKNFTRMALFSEKAREFYRQRMAYGKDDYESFDPNEILGIDIENSNDKFILQKEISIHFQSRQFKKMRVLAKKYFQSYGYVNIVSVFYFCSFLGTRLYEMAKAIIYSNR